MGQLTLIRHGQARAFEPDSDRLTELGEQQARSLGEYWLRQNVAFDEVYCGSLRRQCHTADLVAERFAEAGRPWPARQTLPGLNEYDAHGLLNVLVPALAEREADFQALLTNFEQHRQSPERNRHFQKMFEAVTTRWLSGELENAEVEAWSAFRARVQNAFKHILAREGRGRRVAVFTSGGVIGLAVQTALQAPESKALEINWRIRNCSLTEFTFSRSRLSLDTFNTLPHLADPALCTYR
jgi:broad specificity phosphatase PhoE